MNNLYDIDPTLTENLIFDKMITDIITGKSLQSLVVLFIISFIMFAGLWWLEHESGKYILLLAVIFFVAGLFFLAYTRDNPIEKEPDIIEVVKPDYVATAALTPGAQCPYLPDEQHVGVDTTWVHDGCVIYNDNGDIVETITIRALPYSVSHEVKNELFSIKHGMKITDEERRAPIVNPDPMIDSQGHARAIYIDNNAALSLTRMEKLPEPLTISISVDNHAGDTDTARKHLYAVREHLGLT